MSEHAICGRPGCGYSLGPTEETSTGTRVLVLTNRWHWQGDRWRHRRKKTSKLADRYADTYAQDWPSGVIVVTDDAGVRHITVSLPTRIECPRCQFRQPVG